MKTAANQQSIYMTNLIPRILYRGDADPSGTRKLQTCFPGSAYGGLLTNLSNGGDGLAFVKESLTELVTRHVSPGWTATHFLSFSEHRSRALAFAAGWPSRQLSPAGEEAWDSLLIGLDTTRFIQCRSLGSGLYYCTFARNMEGPLPIRSIHQLIARHFEKAKLKPVQMLLIDATAYFSACVTAGVRGLEQSLVNSQRDAEWLVLPLDAASEILGEQTCALDDGCIASVDFFRFGDI